MRLSFQGFFDIGEQFSLTFAANGNVTSYFDSVNQLWSGIGYDSLNRLTSAQVSPAFESAQSTNFCWGYDSFGNRTSQVMSNATITLSSDGKSCSPQSPPTATWSGTNTVYTAANQISSNADPVSSTNYGSPVQYDPTSASGNVVADGLTDGTPHSYLYDGEGRICAVQLPSTIPGVSMMIQYLYDAEGKRVGKGTISSWSCNIDSNGFQLTKEYVLGQGGEQVSELDGSGNWMHTNVYVGGQLLATLDPVAGHSYDHPAVHYQRADWLGTRRMQVSPIGTLEETCQSLPFGDEMNCVPTSAATSDDATEHHFTGKERDTESGNDYFGARYFASSMGRFMSPRDRTVDHDSSC